MESTETFQWGDGRASIDDFDAVSTARVYGMASAMLGLQYCWAVQNGWATSVLLELGLSKRWVAAAWLAGPLAGLVMQPLVGVVSDRWQGRWGRRCPFVWGGALGTVAALLAFAYAGAVARCLPGVSALAVAMIAFWSLDFSINAVQAALRALIYDQVPAARQEGGNGALAFYTAAGTIVGYGLGGARLNGRLLPSGWFATDAQALLVLGAVLVLVSAAVTVAASVSRDRRRTEGDVVDALAAAAADAKPSIRQMQQRWREVVATVRAAPHPFWRVFLIQLFSWFAWFALFVYASPWFGVEVYGGEPHATPDSAARRRYDTGVRQANRAFAAQNVLAALYAAALPHLPCELGSWHSCTIKYLLAQLVQAAALLLMPFLGANRAWLASALLISLGVPWASTMTLPWAIVGRHVQSAAYRSDAGLYAAALNASQCLSEILVSVLGAGIVRGDDGGSVPDRQWVLLLLGGVSAAAGAGLVAVYRVS